MSSASKRKGTAWESALRDYLRGAGLDVETLRQVGSRDEGDLVVRLPRGGVLVVEAKNRAQISLPQFLREAEVEADEFASARGLERSRVHGIAAVKARRKSVGDGYVVLTVDGLLGLLEAVAVG